MSELLSKLPMAPLPQGAPAAEGAVAGFDFLHGRWEVRHTKLRERLAACRDWYDFPGTLDVAPILGGLGNFDHNSLADPLGAYEAHSLRLHSPVDTLWSIWWLDSRDVGAGLGQPVVGRFEGSKITLFGDDALRGTPIKVRTTYEAIGETGAQWTQAFQDDRGEWEVNWIMDFKRMAA
jgi:hypothetical protein